MSNLKVEGSAMTAGNALPSQDHKPGFKETPMADEPCLSIDETVALLTAHAFTVDDPESSENGRTLIHSRLGGIGADHNLSGAIALAERASWRGWIGSLLGHDLGIEVQDVGRVRLYAFDVPRPQLSADGFLDLVADTIACLADGGHVVKRQDAPWDEAVIEWAWSRTQVVDCEIVDEDEPLGFPRITDGEYIDG